MAVQPGKRYRCAGCGGEVLVTKPSATAVLLCCGVEMEQRQPKQTASAD